MTLAAYMDHFSKSGLSNDVAEDILGLALDGDLAKVELRLIPMQWGRAPRQNLTWINEIFPPNPKARIPKSPGVYVFVVEPKLFGFEKASALLYVGKAACLYDRIGSYIGELNSRMHQSKRPHVWRMINVWHGYLSYYYTITASVKDAEEIEREMLASLIPYFNKELPAEISAKQRAFP